jgi:pantoate--beta-alanine ligase
MRIIESVSGMQAAADELRASGRKIGLVPTMGYLHEGHLELMRAAAKQADVVVASIFVNPTQFGPGEDLDRYPRDFDGDVRKAGGAGVEVIFAPTAEEMYPPGFQTKVRVERVTKHLCGLSRPVHFEGVTTVVCKLFNCVKPDVAVFGEKDFQQLVVIERMVIDLNMEVRIVGVPVQREPDGLAMSSRNAYLNAEERRSALSLFKSLELARRLYNGGERDARVIRDAVIGLISSHPFTSVDYVEVCDPVSLEAVDVLKGRTLLALAVNVGRTRLIDNCTLGG